MTELESNSKEDARTIESLRHQLEDAGAFIKAKPIFQQKISQLQQELMETKRTLADCQQVSTLNDNRLAESQEQLELCMLDKEVAEERAEAAEMELSELQEKLANMEVELEAYHEGGANFDPDSPAKSGLAFVQLEKHNDRLKEALLRYAYSLAETHNIKVYVFYSLREVSHETETEQRERIAELEKELAGSDDLHGMSISLVQNVLHIHILLSAQFEATLINLSNAENHIDELKLQLDDALGAEEILVQLTERNLMLGEVGSSQATLFLKLISSEENRRNADHY